MGIFGVSPDEVVSLANQIAGRRFICERPDAYSYWLIDTASHPHYPGSAPVSADQVQAIAQNVWTTVAGRFGMDRRPAKRLLKVAIFASDGKWYTVGTNGGTAHASNAPF